MQLIFSPEDADALYAKMGPGQRSVRADRRRTPSPGIAALGGKCGFIGQVADDQLGEVFAHDIQALGVAFRHRGARRRADRPARCLIFVTPDGQRTMNTFLGASQFLPEAALDRDLIASGRDPLSRRLSVGPRGTARRDARAIEIARKARAARSPSRSSDTFVHRRATATISSS